MPVKATPCTPRGRPTATATTPSSNYIALTGGRTDHPDLHIESRAHWRHTENTTELVHRSEDSSPQPKREIDHIRHFYTAHDRKCLYFTVGAPIHPNCAFHEASEPPTNAIPWLTQLFNPDDISIASTVLAR